MTHCYDSQNDTYVHCPSHTRAYIAIGIIIPSIVALVIIAVSFYLRYRRDDSRRRLQRPRLRRSRILNSVSKRVKRGTESDISQPSPPVTINNVNDKTPPYTHPIQYHSRDRDQLEGTFGILPITAVQQSEPRDELVL